MSLAHLHHGRYAARLLRAGLLTTLLATLGVVSATSQTADAAATTTQRITTGGSYTSPSGTVWTAGSGFVGGQTYATRNSIAGTGDQPLYTTERFGNFSFTTAVSNGDYNLTLRFAEIFWTQVGRRVFNVSINTRQVLGNFDILAEAAPNYALDRTFPVSVTDGTLTITFASVLDNAKISSLELVPSVSTPPPSANSQFVSVCGAVLCMDGQPWRIKGATAYGQYANPSTEIALARQANVNTLELVEFDTRHHVLADVQSEATWKRVDQFVAYVGQAGLHVILNLSEYGQSLNAAGYMATAFDWNPYLSFIANRVNTVTGATYAHDPTIAMVELWGEIPAPAYGSSGAGTTQQMTDFFSRSLAQWKSLAPSILISSGGFSQLNDPNSGIPWKAIMSDPNNATCDVEINSTNDRDTTIPMVTQYCQSIGKPWFLAAWSSCWGKARGGWDSDYWPDDQTMATHAQDMYRVSNGGARAAMSSVGADFWNLANSTPVYNRTCDIGPRFPLTFAAVRQS